MIGTLINVATVLIGGGIACLIGERFPKRIQKTVMAGLGLFTMLLGVQNFIGTENILIVLISLLIGAVIGEWLGIEEGLNGLGEQLQKKFANQSEKSSNSTFVQGFVVASLLFCVGPMSILGSIQDGLTGDFTTLFIKAMMDGFAAIAFASSLGIGVLFSSVIVFLYQGSITLLANQVQSFITEAMITEMNAVGGALLVGIGISSLLAIKKIRIGSFLPALFIAPLMVWLVSTVGY
ncbi:MAG: DUF554 domain-containing protein [Anaerolineaceae bacterium]|nr:DUF554 domain-containing protein [Anaerolineaceae bacterium]